MNCNSAIRYTFFIFFILLLGSSCGTIRHLEEGETLLRKNKFKILDKKKVDDVGDLEYQLNTLTYQKPNARILGLQRPGPWFYYRVQNRIQTKQDTSWWDKFVLKNWAVEPSIYSLEQADASARNMENSLRNKGYFNAEVEFETKRKGLRKKKTNVTYYIRTGNRYRLDTVQFYSKDTTIHKILQEIKDETLLIPGAPLDNSLYEQEKTRITLHLLDQGYANFYKNYVSKLWLDPIGDNKGEERIKNVGLEVLLPKDSSQHKKYTIGDVSIITLYDENGNPITAKDSIFNNSLYYVGEGKHFVKLKAIDRKLFLRKGDLFSLENVNKTRVQLGNLDIFQFVNIKRTNSTTAENTLNYEIRLIPKKRQEVGYDFEFNNSRIANNSSNAFLGTAASVNYKNRNMFRGGEVFTARMEGGAEVVPGRRIQDFDVRAWNLNLNFTMDFPTYHDLFKTDRLLTKLFIPNFLFPGKSDKFYKQLKEQGITSTSLKYNILSSTDNYRIDIFAGTWGWKFRYNKHWRMTVNKVGIDFLDPILSDSFQILIVDNNPYLDRSFRPQLFTGAILRDLNLIFQKDVGVSGKSSVFARLNFETSGFEVWAVNSIVNGITGRTDTFKLADKYEYSQYVKLEGDFRYYRKFRGGRLFAARMNIGIAGDYGFSDEVPYVKQFAVGNPNSMRAWRFRELGPGSYIDPNVTASTTNFYQTGDFKFEVNLEYRFDLFWYLKGAVFLDAGNIWSLNDNIGGRAGAGIGSFGNFIDEIAVGTGFGLRLDVEYFILRFDLGYKIRNPFPDSDGYHGLITGWNDLALNKFRGSLSVGYPF